jgi:hypothetical protein
MCASPYDLAALGFPAVAIETAAGREAYQSEQRRLAADAEPIRRRVGAVAAALAVPAGTPDVNNPANSG